MNADKEKKTGAPFESLAFVVVGMCFFMVLSVVVGPCAELASRTAEIEQKVESMKEFNRTNSFVR